MKTSLNGFARAKTAPTVEVSQFAILGIGVGAFALDIMRIKGIINPQPITAVPKTPMFIEGVIELRGAILPIVDMRKRFDVMDTDVDRNAKYVLVAIGGVIVGLIVDGVSEVIRVPKSEIRPAPAMAVGDESRYFSGVCQHNGRIIMIIDLDAILSSSERISLAGLAGVG
jgi:purine-binding chemotaxis protein CheW